MTRILLIHGVWHGPWCGDGFAARLVLDVGWERVADRVHAWVGRVRSPAKGAA